MKKRFRIVTPARGACGRILLVLALLGIGSPARSEVLESDRFGLGIAPEAALAPEGASEERFRLAMSALPSIPEVRFGEVKAPPAEPPRKPKVIWIGAVSVAAIIGSAYNSFGYEPNEPFHFENEGWFGQNTFAGGADKTSHFVSYWGAALLLNDAYWALGMRDDRALLLGSAISIAAGLTTEFGDGTTRYGFSWEDLFFDALGAASALGVHHYGLRDLIGFRAGLLPAPEVECCQDPMGKDYTKEIYTADLKIAGLARRLRFKPGPARFLLFSVTYGSKGYPYASPEIRERQVGFEIGLAVAEVARALGVPEQKWWGRILLTILDIIRFPYTSVGFYYDLNHDRWYGPSNGASWAQQP